MGERQAAQPATLKPLAKQPVEQKILDKNVNDAPACGATLYGLDRPRLHRCKGKSRRRSPTAPSSSGQVRDRARKPLGAIRCGCSPVGKGSGAPCATVLEERHVLFISGTGAR